MQGSTGKRLVHYGSCDNCDMRQLRQMHFVKLKNQKNERLKMESRGLKNNNPLNIRRGEKWKGLAQRQTDPSFCQFEKMEYGWRAAFWLLTRTYYHKYRLYTIRSIVERWAPPNENNTEAYVSHISTLMKYAADVPLGIPGEHPERWMMLGAAMALHENGLHELDYMSMLQGWGMCRRDSLTP